MGGQEHAGNSGVQSKTTVCNSGLPFYPFARAFMLAGLVLAIGRYVILSFGIAGHAQNATVWAESGAICVFISVAAKFLWKQFVSAESFARWICLLLMFWLIAACFVWIGLALMPAIAPSYFVIDSLAVSLSFTILTGLTFCLLRRK